MSIFDKENAILAGQVAQGQVLSQIATAIATISTGDNTALLAAIAAVDAHVGQVQQLIGTDAAISPTPAPAPDSPPSA